MSDPLYSHVRQSFANYIQRLSDMDIKRWEAFCSHYGTVLRVPESKRLPVVMETTFEGFFLKTLLAVRNICAHHGLSDDSCVRWLGIETDETVENDVYDTLIKGMDDWTEDALKRVRWEMSRETGFEHLGARSGLDDGLIAAAGEGDLEEVNRFIKEGADIHTDNDLAIRTAAASGHLDVVMYFISQGADISSETLWFAREHGHREVADYLERVLEQRHIPTGFEHLGAEGEFVDYTALRVGDLVEIQGIRDYGNRYGVVLRTGPWTGRSVYARGSGPDDAVWAFWSYGKDDAREKFFGYNLRERDALGALYNSGGMYRIIERNVGRTSRVDIGFEHLGASPEIVVGDRVVLVNIRGLEGIIPAERVLETGRVVDVAPGMGLSHAVDFGDGKGAWYVRRANIELVRWRDVGFEHLSASPQEKRIKISYDIVTPESVKRGDVSEAGWENEEGVVVADVDEAVEFLRDEGIEEASSSFWNVGTWYVGYHNEDVVTGEVTTKYYHLDGFSNDEEMEIYYRLFPQRGHFVGKVGGGAVPGFEHLGALVVDGSEARGWVMDHLSAFYDNGGKTADRYTVVMDDATMYYLSANCGSPNGVNVYAGEFVEGWLDEGQRQMKWSIPTAVLDCMVTRYATEIESGLSGRVPGFEHLGAPVNSDGTWVPVGSFRELQIEDLIMTMTGRSTWPRMYGYISAFDASGKIYVVWRGTKEDAMTAYKQVDSEGEWMYHEPGVFYVWRPSVRKDIGFEHLT